MAFSYPLRWPPDRPRTPFPEAAKFYRLSESGMKQPLTFNTGRERMITELEKLGVDDVEITTNVKWNLRGQVDKNFTFPPSDRGVAVYFKLNGQAVHLACDRWDSLGDNMAAIAAHIDALRGQERWGVGDIKTAFSGHIALPNFSARARWTKLLDLDATASEPDIQAAWRAKIREARTEADQMDINIARDEALKERGFR